MFAGQARANVDALCPSDGLLASIGLGLRRIVPLAMLVNWFPHKRGTITAMAGAGAFINAPIAERLISSVGVSKMLGAAVRHAFV